MTSPQNAGNAGYTLEVVCPVATRFGEDVLTAAPRLPSLEGKTIGLLWNGKPNGDVALNRAGELIGERVTGVETILYKGSWTSNQSLLDDIAKRCDAVIACTADCGSCTSWIVHDCVYLERGGVPTVIIASAGFEHDIEASSRAFGLTGIQYVVVPKVYNNLEPEVAATQTEPVVDEIRASLTSASPASSESSDARSALAQFAGFDRFDAVRQMNIDYLQKDWGDGYPLMPPTLTEVSKLIDAVDGDPDDVVCLLPPGNGVATVRHVAANAAMAGCLPDEMPVIMAALRALAKTRPPVNRIAMMSTSAHAPLWLVNGPASSRLGINGGRGCMGPGKRNEVNIRIGRAILFCMKNLGCWYPGVMDLDTLGTARKFSLVLAENEEESPWTPYHVSEGFDASESTVTLFFTAGDWDIGFQGNIDGKQLARAIAANIGGGTLLNTRFMDYIDGTENSEEGRLVLIPPPHAVPLHDAGFDKDGLARYFHQLVREPVERLIEPSRKLHHDGKVRPEWEWLFELSPEVARQTTLPAIDNPSLFRFVVSGSVRAKDMVFPTLGLPVTEAVTATPSGMADRNDARRLVR